jgi:Flp pilus assembly pilin Flp
MPAKRALQTKLLQYAHHYAEPGSHAGLPTFLFAHPRADRLLLVRKRKPAASRSGANSRRGLFDEQGRPASSLPHLRGNGVATAGGNNLGDNPVHRLLFTLWHDDSGAIISIEMLFLFVILTLGLIAGWTNLQAAINTELTEQANAILALNNSFVISGGTGGNNQNGNSGSSSTQTPQTLGWTWSSANVVGAGFTVNVTVSACP